MKLERLEAMGALYLSQQPISLSFAVSARVHGTISQEQLEAGLAAVCKRHPLIPVRPVERPDGPPYFTDEGVPPVPLRVVDRVEDQDWVAQVEREIQQPGSYLTGPLLRCVWVRGGDISDIILISDHLVADGLATVYALRDLLSFMAEPGQAVSPISSPPLHELVPPDVMALIREDIANLPPEEAPDSVEGSPDSGSEESMPAAGPACIVPFSLEEAETATLVARCKAEGVTVQGAICAAFMTPFAELHPDQPVRNAEIPVDLRRRMLAPVGDVYDCMIGLTIISFDCTPGRSLWDVARGASAALAAMRDQDVFAAPMVMIALIDRVPKAPWKIDYDVSVSNLGRVAIPETYGDLRLESIYGPIFPATGPDHRILGVSTFGGRLRCTFSTRGSAHGAVLARGRELLASMLD